MIDGSMLPSNAVKQRIRASVVCVHRAHLLCVRLRDPTTRVPRWFVPGGAIEPGESPRDSAVREALEETGYCVALDDARELTLRYPYEWNGSMLDVTTHFFRATLVDPDAVPAPVCDASYHEGVAWLPLSELEQAIGFHSGMYRSVLALL
jgi:tRNA(adenine34) deaminase